MFVCSNGLVIAIVLILAPAGCRTVDSAHRPSNGHQTRPENIETIHFSSYKPTEDQIRFARASFSSQENREDMMKLVDILRQSTLVERDDQNMGNNNNEFDNETVADAAYDAANDQDIASNGRAMEYQPIDRRQRPLAAPNALGIGVPHYHQGKNQRYGRMPHDSGASSVAPLVNVFCNMLMNTPEYMSLCRDARVQHFIMNNLNKPKEQYDVEFIAQHLQPVNNDFVSEFRDRNTVDQSVLYILAKICMGPLPIACQNVARHM